MHKLLQRQLKKLYGSAEHAPEVIRLLSQMVDEAYAQADADRKLLERSLDLTSQELLEANAKLRRDRRELELRVQERTRDLLRVNASLEREIVERAEAESALRDSQRLYQTLAESSPAGILQTDAGGRCVYANRKWCEMSGVGESEAAGEGWLEGIHPDDRRRVAGEWRRAVERRRSRFVTEFRFRRPNRSVLWVVLHAVALPRERGRPSGFILTTTDISERRRAEEAIRRSEEKFRSLFEDSMDMIYLSKPDGTLLDVNPAGVLMLGYASKRRLLEGQKREEIFLGREDRQRLLERVEQDGFVKDLELTARRLDGQVLSVLVTCTAVRDETGRIASLRGILRDVTEQRELAKRLQQAQKLEAVGRLAGGVAHDFNNLLTAIIGYCELMRMNLGPDSPVHRQIDEIARAGKRGAALTRHLLAFSRGQMLEMRVLDLNQIVADMEKLLRRVIGEDVELVTRLDPGLGAVRADSGQIEQVLLNLAINARDAMPSGGALQLETESVEVTTGERWRRLGLAPGSYVRLVVADTGSGIEESILDQIFEPFFTTKEAGRGTGLGLSSVYGIVQQSKGCIDVASTRGEGTRFEIYLPVIEDRPDAAAGEVEAPRIPRGDETILLAEDEPAVRAFLSQFLERQGYRVISAADGEEALRRALESDTRIQLLLSDVVMPRLNGIQLARQLLRREPGLKVLLMSGYTGERAAESARFGNGSADFLQKPFSTEDLGHKLRELLGSAGGREAEG